MEAMKCPSCGSTELVKIETNVYKCSHCGTRSLASHDTLTPQAAAAKPEPQAPLELEPSEEVRALASQGKLIEAIKIHRQQTGVDLRTADQAVRKYGIYPKVSRTRAILGVLCFFLSLVGTSWLFVTLAISGRIQWFHSFSIFLGGVGIGMFLLSLFQKAKTGIKSSLVIITISAVSFLILAFTIGGIPIIPSLSDSKICTSPSKQVPAYATSKTADCILPAVSEKWSDTGIYLHANDSIQITASGIMDLGGLQSDPNGNPSIQTIHQATFTGAPLGALVGKIGYGEPFLIGKTFSSQAKSSGDLQLLINDILNGYFNNTGEFQIAIFISK
jgi:hypothetical protein